MPETKADAKTQDVDEPIRVDPLLAARLTPEELKHRQALLDDWSEYVALTDIGDPYGSPGVLAYAKGAPVPTSNVKRWLYDQQGLVAKRSSKEGKAALERLAPVTPATIRAPGDPKD